MTTTENPEPLSQEQLDGLQQWASVSGESSYMNYYRAIVLRLLREHAERSADLAAISLALDREFTNKRSGDLLDDIGAFIDHHKAKERQIKQQQEQIERLRGDVEAGLQISGSFFEALKPLKLAAINVANPGQHVTDLVTDLRLATAGRDYYITLAEQRQEQIEQLNGSIAHSQDELSYETSKLNKQIDQQQAEIDGLVARWESNRELWSDAAEALGMQRLPVDIDGVIAKVRQMRPVIEAARCMVTAGSFGNACEEIRGYQDLEDAVKAYDKASEGNKEE